MSIKHFNGSRLAKDADVFSFCARDRVNACVSV